MKLVLEKAFVLLTVAILAAAEDFYRDENNIVYTLGFFGERVYEKHGGQVNEKKKDKIEFGHQNEFTDFGWQLFSKANKESTKNFVISSLSPQLLLSLVSSETKGATKSEITHAIKSEGYSKLGELIKKLKSEDSARQLEIATAFFVDKTLQTQLKENYKNTAKSSQCDIYFMNFTSPKKLQSKYDQWLKAATHGALTGQRIQLDPRSKMVLSSALYFKGDWLFGFNKAENGNFLVPGTQGVPVEMMSLEFKRFHYGHLSDGNGEWLSIPYNSTEAMLILLPNKTRNVDIDRFVDITPSSDISDIINIISEHNHPRTIVNITMPSFKINSGIGLTEPLQKMGIRKIFTQNSEFFPFNDDTPLQVSSALQQTSLEVNESGSIGASVSKFSIVALSVQVPIKEVVFTVDRPFVAVIVNRLYRIPYFVAKVSDPRKV